MPRIKNELYREFLDSGTIQILNAEDIEKALKNVTGRHIKEGRALIICLYYTGARPSEVLLLKARDVTKDKGYIIVQMSATKGGLARPIMIPYKHKMARELYVYSQSIFPDMPMFYNFKNNYTRIVMSKRGIPKSYTTTTDKLRYYFKKWFQHIDLTPYFLRHNRFSALTTKGHRSEEIRQMKGSRTDASVKPYQHMSTDTAKKLGRSME